MDFFVLDPLFFLKLSCAGCGVVDYVRGERKYEKREEKRIELSLTMCLSESEEGKGEKTNEEDSSVSVLSIKVHDGEQEE